MTTEIYLDGKKYILPHEIVKTTHKHHEPEKWVCMWFYKENHNKTAVFPDEIKSDIITSKSEYQRGIFYKMSFVSANDDCFDYFFKLKEGVPKNIVKKNSKYKKSRDKQKKPKHTIQSIKEKYPIVNGKFVVKFE